MYEPDGTKALCLFSKSAPQKIIDFWVKIVHKILLWIPSLGSNGVGNELVKLNGYQS